MEEGRIDNKIKLGPRLINLSIKIVDEKPTKSYFKLKLLLMPNGAFLRAFFRILIDHFRVRHEKVICLNSNERTLRRMENFDLITAAAAFT